jgi:hypothetical protein
MILSSANTIFFIETNLRSVLIQIEESECLVPAHQGECALEAFDPDYSKAYGTSASQPAYGAFSHLG